jgi:murein DD-endopeptidase MepM/ murein hydrolase activator NlpD
MLNLILKLKNIGVAYSPLQRGGLQSRTGCVKISTWIKASHCFLATIIVLLVLNLTLLPQTFAQDNSSDLIATSNPSPSNSDLPGNQITLNPSPDNIVDSKTRLGQNDYTGKSEESFFLGSDNEGRESPSPRDDGTECEEFYLNYYPYLSTNPEYYTDPIYQTTNNPTGEIKNPYVSTTIPDCPTLQECTKISNNPIKNRRIGTCNDGIYTISSRETDTAGNSGEWVERSVERDTVRPDTPNLDISKAGDIWAEFLAIEITGAEAETTAIIEVASTKGFEQTMEVKIDAGGSYATSNLIGKLLCGGVRYEVRARLRDRAGNVGEPTQIKEIITQDCPVCGYSGGEFAVPLRNNLKGGPVQWVITQDFEDHGGSVDLATVGEPNFGHGVPVYPIAPGKVEVVKYQGGVPGIYGKDNHVLIDHGGGLKAWYVHFMNETNEAVGGLPKVGDFVDTNTIIGHMGNTGKFETAYSGAYAGTHLHLNVKLNGVNIDPTDKFGSGPNVECYADSSGSDPYDGLNADNLGPVKLRFKKSDGLFGGNVQLTRQEIPSPRLISASTEDDLNYTIFGVAIKKGQPIEAVVYEEKCNWIGLNCNEVELETIYTQVEHTEVLSYKDGFWLDPLIDQRWDGDRFSFTKKIPGDIDEDQKIYSKSRIFGSFDCLGYTCSYDHAISKESNKFVPKNMIKSVLERNILISAYSDHRNSSLTLRYSPNNDKYRREYDTNQAPEVWLISHGMLDKGDSDAMVNIADSLHQNLESKGIPHVIINIDWRAAADAGSILRDPHKTDQWIRPTSERLYSRLKDWGLEDPSKVNLVGHSMGTMVINEIARQYNLETGQSVDRMYYLDPPNYYPTAEKKEFRVDDRFGNSNSQGSSNDAIYKESHGYTVHARGFIQRAYTGVTNEGRDGLCGNTKLAKTAKEYLDFGFHDILNDASAGCPAHGSPNYAFGDMIRQRGFGNNSLLDLNRDLVVSQKHDYTNLESKDGYIYSTGKEETAESQNLTVKENGNLIQYGFAGIGNHFSNFNFGMKAFKNRDKVVVVDFNDNDDRISLQSKGEDNPNYGDTKLYTFSYSVSGNTIKRKASCSVGLFVQCEGIEEFEDMVIEGSRSGEVNQEELDNQNPEIFILR